MKAHLYQNDIHEFSNLSEVIDFQNNYEALRHQIISNSEFKIENEKKEIISYNEVLKNSIESGKYKAEKEILEQIEYLKSQLHALSTSIPNNIWTKIIRYFKEIAIKKKIHKSELNIPSKVHEAVSELINTYQENENRYNYITSQFKNAIINNCAIELNALERKKAIIDEINNSIWGAIGEQKVVNELKKLPDNHVLINDFSLKFDPPIYNRNENNHIMSIQLDHLLIAPSGIFLIETKNWSEQSLKNLSLRSPVSQLRRTSYALFTILNNANGIDINHHHWGKKKISLKNLVVLINQRPREEFQYVKVLTLNELLSYIKYFPPIYTSRETDEIANKLINLSSKE